LRVWLFLRKIGLYIYSTNITSGQLEWLNILDFTRTNTSFKFEQGTESTEWNIAHNLNTQDLFVIVYDSDGNKQIESEIQFQNDNEIKLIFSESISGKALLFGASVISSPSNIYTKEEIDELLKNIEVSGGSNIILPEGGSDGYLLSKNGDELGWTNPDDVGTKLPEDGLDGQVLIKDSSTVEGFRWNNISGSVRVSVGNSNQKIIVPEGTRFNVTPELHIVTKDIPKQLATNAQYEIDSPFGNVACDCYILVNNGVNDKWSRLDVVYESKSYGCLANCPGDGKLYLTTSPTLIAVGSGMQAPYAITSNTFSDWAIVVEGPIVSNNNYSTEEQVIGTWIDGRPVYRQTFETTTTNNKVLVNTGDVDVLVAEYGYIQYDSDYKISFPRLYNSSTAYTCIKNKNIILESVGSYSGKSAIIVVEYVKF